MSSTSPAVLTVRNALGISSTKIPIDVTTFVLYVLPPLVSYFIVAVLAITPQTRTARVALWPLVALLAFRAACSVDISFGKTEEKFNNFFVLCMIVVAVRTLDWTLAKGPLVRHLRPANSSPSTVMDALDLASNFRGHGWEWSQPYIPRETRPTNRMEFIFHTFISAAAHALLHGVSHRAILILAPVGVGPIPEGSTIFDESLPFPVRYFRATIISTLTTFTMYAFVQLIYDVCTILGILVLGQGPSQWPPAFNAPWRATSLSDFWGRRWHQFFRRGFLLGGYLLSPILGRAGISIGAFLVSILSHTMVIKVNSRVENWWMLVGFGMMAAGIVAEQVYRQLTGRRVCGIPGRVWTMAWILPWNNVTTEGFARAGMFGGWGPITDSISPLRALVERLVIEFDFWLHTI